MLLTEDLGYSVFEDFQDQCPRQYFNMGVTEAGTMGIATGFSMKGKIPIVYSIVPFISMRPFEKTGIINPFIAG